jgi:hypothetical protein
MVVFSGASPLVLRTVKEDGDFVPLRLLMGYIKIERNSCSLFAVDVLAFAIWKTNIAEHKYLLIPPTSYLLG